MAKALVDKKRYKMGVERLTLCQHAEFWVLWKKLEFSSWCNGKLLTSFKQGSDKILGVTFKKKNYSDYHLEGWRQRKGEIKSLSGESWGRWQCLGLDKESSKCREMGRFELGFENRTFWWIGCAIDLKGMKNPLDSGAYVSSVPIRLSWMCTCLLSA